MRDHNCCSIATPSICSGGTVAHNCTWFEHAALNPACSCLQGRLAHKGLVAEHVGLMEPLTEPDSIVRKDRQTDQPSVLLSPGKAPCRVGWRSRCVAILEHLTKVQLGGG